jgi:hypothetical protein
LTGEAVRGSVSRYHQKPTALMLNKTKHRIDVAGLRSAVQRSAFKIEGGEIASRYTIGMEVEKTSLHRGAVREYELFCGFETDASCGYEAVTHVLPLLPSGQWRTKVFDMMHKAERIIDDRFSPSDRSCGGHVTLSVDGMTGAELIVATRKYSGIVLALFRHRLKNTFCGGNTNMRDLDTERASVFSANDDRYRHYPRYQMALVKGNLLEFRVVARYESVKQMMRRYELFYALVDAATNTKPTQATFLKTIRPIILSMYNGDEAKANEIFAYAKQFQKFIDTGVIAEDIKRFLF